MASSRQLFVNICRNYRVAFKNAAVRLWMPYVGTKYAKKSLLTTTAFLVLCEAKQKLDLQAPDQESLKQEHLLRAASANTADTVTTLLSQTAFSIIETQQKYRDMVSTLIQLLDYHVLVLGNKEEEERMKNIIAEARGWLEKYQKHIEDLELLLSTVQKLADASAEVAFLAEVFRVLFSIEQQNKKLDALYELITNKQCSCQGSLSQSKTEALPRGPEFPLGSLEDLQTTKSLENESTKSSMINYLMTIGDKDHETMTRNTLKRILTRELALQFSLTDWGWSGKASFRKLKLKDVVYGSEFTSTSLGERVYHMEHHIDTARKQRQQMETQLQEVEAQCAEAIVKHAEKEERQKRVEDAMFGGDETEGEERDERTSEKPTIFEDFEDMVHEESSENAGEKENVTENKEMVF